MPPKKDKGKKNKKNEKENEIVLSNIANFWKKYELCCYKSYTIPATSIKNIVIACRDEETAITKLIVEPKITNRLEDPTVSLEPLIKALIDSRYDSIKELYVWGLPMSYADVVSVGKILEKPIFQIKHLELIDTLLASDHMDRISESLTANLFLSTLAFDYNEFKDEGCKYLCKGLTKNSTIISLSLCYCELTENSSNYLSEAVSTSAIRELYLDGNLLQCAGLSNFLKPFIEQAKVEQLERDEEIRKKEEVEAEALKKIEEDKIRKLEDPDYVAPEAANTASPPTSANKKAKSKKKKKKLPPPLPEIGPWLTKLHIADNGIDNLNGQTQFSAIKSMEDVRELIGNSKCLEEIDLHDNLIGDLGGRQIVFGLEERKEAKLPNMKVQTTHRLLTETFVAVQKLGGGLKKKKKKRGKKKK